MEQFFPGFIPASTTKLLKCLKMDPGINPGNKNHR